jgi:hypothetical protein
LVLLSNQLWSPPLRLQVSDCSTFSITCDVTSTAVFWILFWIYWMFSMHGFNVRYLRLVCIHSKGAFSNLGTHAAFHFRRIGVLKNRKRSYASVESVGHDSSADTATRYRTDGSWIESWWGYIAQLSRAVLGLTFPYAMGTESFSRE